jgi:homoserine dehydrogenase
VSAPLRIALLGAGSVGRAVAERLLTDGEWLADRADGRRLELSAVATRTPARLAGLKVPQGVAIESDPVALVANRPFDVVVELLGGLEPAGEVLRTALDAGTAVVTANKMLLAESGEALEAQARRSRAALRFEAAVAGGTPLLSVIAEDLVAVRIERIRGVINGTTNWILDSMETSGLDLAEAVAAARAAGYAEADPSLDIEGIDAAHKLVILGRLAFGLWIPVAAVRRVATEPPGAGGPGIAGVTRADIEAARAQGQHVRLVAEVRRRGADIEAEVVPRQLLPDDPLAAARGVTNIVAIEGQPVGSVTISGPGAGGPATAAAVIADLVRIARGAGSTWAGLPARDLQPAAAR